MTTNAESDVFLEVEPCISKPGRNLLWFKIYKVYIPTNSVLGFPFLHVLVSGKQYGKSSKG